MLNLRDGVCSTTWMFSPSLFYFTLINLCSTVVTTSGDWKFHSYAWLLSPLFWFCGILEIVHLVAVAISHRAESPGSYFMHTGDIGDFS